MTCTGSRRGFTMHITAPYFISCKVHKPPAAPHIHPATSGMVISDVLRWVHTAVQAVEDAIREGVIYWHAFPFNAQLEFMDEELLRSSVRLTHELDVRFDQAPKFTLSQVGGAATF